MNALMPLFPLQLVPFPGEHLNLHIFEPRYKQMINECHANGSTFGIPAYIDNKVMDVGTEMKLVKIQKTYDNGEMDIKTEGVAVFKIDEFIREAPDKLYSGGKISPIVQTKDGNSLVAGRIIESIGELFSLLNIDKEAPQDPDTFYSFDVAHHVGFTLAQEYELLTIKKEIARQEFMMRHLEQLIPVVREMESLRKRVQMNGHFKNVIPPEL